MIRKVGSILFEYSGFLIIGAVAALVWANTHPDTYKYFTHHLFEFQLTSPPEHKAGDDTSKSGNEKHGTEKAPDKGDEHTAPPEEEKHEAPDEQVEKKDDGHSGGTHIVAGGGHGKGDIFNLHFLINDILMALFFAMATKEVWEALLPGGSLASPKKAATPLLATVGGMAGPAGLYIAGAFIFSAPHLVNGWAVPCATDIAFSYLAARIVFGAGHPAIPFLLLLAIADDAGGLIILATVYPQKEISMVLFLAFVIPAVVFGFILRKLKVKSWIPYIFGAGTISWFGFFYGGIHPALSLVPIIPTLPHAHTDLGLFCLEELKRKDPLNKFEHNMKIPVELILGMFGLVNAGVLLTSVGVATGLVTVGLLVGKPVGILLFTLLAVVVFKFEMPKGMGWKDVITLGMAAGIGFTVALFVSTVAFTKDLALDLDAAKLGALLSFGAFGLTFVLGKVLGIEKVFAKEGKTTGH